MVRILQKLHHHLKPGGTWLWADFIPPQNAWQRFLMSSMLLFFKVTTKLPAKEVYQVSEVFLRKKMELKEEKYFFKGFICSAVFSKPHV